MLISPWVMFIAIAVRSLPRRDQITSNMVDPEFFNDNHLIEQAGELFNDEKLLAAARTLRQVENPNDHLNDKHLKLLKIANLLEKAVLEFLSPPGEEWKKQGETHGSYDTSIYYKIEGGGKLTCRIETPIPKEMLVPILSVLNESSLYHTWIPSWKKPMSLGIQQSHQLVHDRRGHQVIQILSNVPWPMATREVLMDVTAVDDIDETGCIIAKMQTLGGNQDGAAHLLPDDFEVPSLTKGAERVDFDGSILFRACPTDHPNYESARRKFSDDLILLQYTMYFDANMAVVPHSLINFVTRVVIGMIWSMLLKVAEEVKSGVRKEHVDIIRDKADFYEWLEDRCQRLLSKKAPHKNAVSTAFVHETLGSGNMNLAF